MVVGSGEGERLGVGVCVGVGDDAVVGLFALSPQPAIGRENSINIKSRVGVA